MKNFQSHFSYNKRQRNGVFYLLLIIVTLQLIFYFVDFSSEDENKIAENEMIAFQKELDSLRLIKAKQSQFKTYPFNPNYISDFKGSQLGMSVEEIDRLFAYRKTGGFINSIEQFKEVTGVKDSLLKVISPYFKFPDWVVAAKSNLNRKPTVVKFNVIVENQDINTALEKDLIQVKGIGEKLAIRIINYRDKLQGFSFEDQLYEVWYLDKGVADEVLKYFKIKSQPDIQKINVNEATFKQVLSIVYIDYELTKKIFNYRDEVAEIQSMEELKKIDGFPLEKFDRIALYLVAK